MSIGKNIRNLRISRNVTQEELGRAVGVSAMGVSQWENDRAEPRMGSIERLAAYFNVPKSAIIDDQPRYEYAAETLPESSELAKLIETYYALSDSGKRLAVALVDTIKQQEA